MMSQQQAQADEIIRRYADLLRQNGCPVSHVPRVEVRTLPTLISYSGGTAPSVLVPMWDDLPLPGQEMFSRWASLVGEGLTGQSLFEDFFNWFLIPHEMTHFFQDISGLLPVLDRFGSETMANRFAVAFWRTQAGSGTQLDRIGRAAKCIYHSLPNPVPAGDDPVRYFNSNYDKIGSIPPVYGWYQLKMTADAYDARASLDFGNMVREALSAPPASRPKP